MLEIVSAGLNIRDKGKKVSEESYILTVIMLVISTLIVLYYRKNLYILRYLLLLCFCAVNINYYVDKKDIDEHFYNFSIAYLVIVLVPIVLALFGSMTLFYFIYGKK